MRRFDVKKFLITLGVVAVVLLGAGSAQYFYVKGHIVSGFDEMINDFKEKGYELSYDNREINHDLTKIQLVLHNPRIRYHENWITKSDVEGSIILNYSLFSPNHVNFSMTGKSTTEWHGEDASVKAQFGVQDVSGYLELENLKKLKRKVVFMKSPVLTLGDKDPLVIKADKFDTDVSFEEGQHAVDLGIFLDTLNISSLTDTPLGGVIQHVSLKGKVSGVVKGKTPNEILTNWYKNTGTLDISDFTIDWSGIDLTSDGSLSVDEKLQPVMTLSAELKNVNKTLDALLKQNVISETSKKILEIFLGAMVKNDEKSDTEKQQSLKLSLTLQDGELSLGPVRIAKGLRIDWSGKDTGVNINDPKQADKMK